MTASILGRRCDYCPEPPAGLVVSATAHDPQAPRVAVGHHGCYQRHLDLLAGTPTPAVASR